MSLEVNLNPMPLLNLDLTAIAHKYNNLSPYTWSFHIYM